MSIKEELEKRMKVLQKKYPNSYVQKFLSSFTRQTTFEGNKSKIYDIIEDLKKGDKRKLYFDCSNGVPKELRAPVWYCMATERCSYEEIIQIKSKKLYMEYWSEAYECEIFDLNKKQARTIDVDVVRLFPEGYKEIFKHEEVRRRIRRIKRMYECHFPNPGYFQGMGDIVAVFFVIFSEYYINEFSIDNYLKTDNEILDTIECATYVLLIYMMKNIYCECKTIAGVKEFHPESLWREIVKFYTLKDKNFNIKYDEFIIKQQIYKILVCFFARDLNIHLTSVIYDGLICGTCCSEGKVFNGIIKLAIAFIEMIKQQGVDLGDLYSFNKESHKFFETITESKTSQLIAIAWYL
ncbi:hypothetical protein EHI8A_075320 [Entamoeba histolytica HM-1:IMSS-B]|uniref:Rab-GAP TBC domain-containing protein n=6 Tax=Entamoeba histolytica TaxID=5759 RepID=C4LWL4_ENTH1|nr:hypothetical protein EHI_069260 [Entamoeba histolytica HM-1:IMSS]EMD42624.1 Hypothetical protein EHI5A_090690 [Entamoeba histolytica KU27]EMH76447.1 hypothetical protein EHI8A_075320 [Entamoeba histolytica HM-1:IMSS-B]EMS12686.1 hypothetical protein KM1_107260 [Entamoeba histolytica HM-3:IMSS]ENY60658.1 hypothetical protein EHI7A_073070 [Entamoeba histolytica HM-1:IMSS-A]GAT93103.1 hypothetical protein CL6EHI_069260 [Entamoeba histolytica]|eukprot:XP_655305.1 hypothetical protein EHI_069260 [Entamoeba histolytica HM-1:IMSS]